MKYTREDYMKNRCSHEAYYGQFVDDSIKAIVSRCIGKDRLLASNDEHLNDIPLGEWDNAAGAIPSRTIADVRASGDVHANTLGVKVCILKAAAYQIIQEAA